MIEANRKGVHVIILNAGTGSALTVKWKGGTKYVIWTLCVQGLPVLGKCLRVSNVSVVANISWIIYVRTEINWTPAIHLYTFHLMDRDYEKK